MTVIKIIEAAGGFKSDAEGQYVRDMDFEAYHGRGHLRATPFRERAKEFADMREAMQYWQTQSKTVPIRPDGKPNRPLTAYTVEIEK